MKIFRTITLIFCLTMPQLTRAEILEIDQATAILPHIQDLDKHSLVSFDVKNVLFVGKDPILSPQFRKEYHAYKLALEQELGKEKSEYLDSIRIKSYQIQLLDAQMPAVIKQIQKTGAKTIAVTSGHIGKYHLIESLEQLRVDRLKSLGIDFSQAFPEFPEIEFFDECGKVRFTFKSGILFAASIPKGEVLNTLLQHINFKPKKIVHIDNSLQKLRSIESFCEFHNIEFVGLHFVRVYGSPIEFDLRISDKQFEILKKESKWLASPKAADLL